MAPRLPAHPNSSNRVWTRQGGVMKPDLTKQPSAVRSITGSMPTKKTKRSSARRSK